MMKEQAFEIFLSNEPTITSAKAVTARMGRARKVESVLGKSLDVIVANDDTTYESLLELQTFGDPRNNLQNVVRKYYKFTHEREFPRLCNYHSAKHP